MVHDNPCILACFQAGDIHRAQLADDFVRAQQQVGVRPACPTGQVDVECRAAQVDAWVASQPRVSWSLPHGGITGFLFLDGLDGDAVARAAWEQSQVRIVPGRFFQVDAALRISASNALGTSMTLRTVTRPSGPANRAAVRAVRSGSRLPSVAMWTCMPPNLVPPNGPLAQASLHGHPTTER